MMKLEITNLPFNSALDEKSFFEWIKGIPSVKNCYGEGRSIFLEFRDSRIPDSDLRELIGLYERYQLNMKPLAMFVSAENRQWFQDNKTSYWHRKMFGG